MKYEFKDMLINGTEFNKGSSREVLQYAIGGMLYMPATRTKIVQDIIEQNQVYPHQIITYPDLS